MFHLCLQTNEQSYHLLGLTNHGSASQLVSSTKLNMFYLAPVSGTIKSTTDWPVSGTRNWPVCHHDNSNWTAAAAASNFL